MLRISLEHPSQTEDFDLGQRITGQPLVMHGAVLAPTAGGVIWLDTAARSHTLIGPAKLARGVTLRTQYLAVLYPQTDAAGVQSSLVGLFQVGVVPPVSLAGVEAALQSSAACLLSSDYLALAGRDGRVVSWQMVEKEHKLHLVSTEPRIVGGGRSLQSGAALNGSLLALAPCRDGDGLLLVVNLASGQVVFEQPLSGDVFVAPLWWKRTLCVLSAAGQVEVFRVALK